MTSIRSSISSGGPSWAGGHAGDGRLGGRGVGAGDARPARRGHPGHRPAGPVRPGGVPPDPPGRPQDPGHLHHRARDHGHRHRGDEPRGLRVPPQAAGARPALRPGRAGLRDQPADARPRGDGGGRAARGRAGPDRRPLRPHAGGLQGDRPGRAPGRDGADPGRDRHRQGAGGPRDLPLQPPVRRAVPGDQLRRHPRDAAGERAVRPREGGLHRRRPAGGSASSSSATAAPCSWTRSAT